MKGAGYPHAKGSKCSLNPADYGSHCSLFFSSVFVISEPSAHDFYLFTVSYLFNPGECLLWHNYCA